MDFAVIPLNIPGAAILHLFQKSKLNYRGIRLSDGLRILKILFRYTIERSKFLKLKNGWDSDNCNNSNQGKLLKDLKKLTYSQTQNQALATAATLELRMDICHKPVYIHP